MHILNMDSETGGGSGGGGGGGSEEKAAATSNEECSIDVKEGGIDKSRKGDKFMCRICHFGKNIIQLGCDCKGDLGSSHRHCADVWFSHKGDTVCEICGKTAKNVRNTEEETSIFMMEWNEMREVATSLEPSGESRQGCKQCFCHWVLACFILLSMLLWFFRGIKIL